ncbi:hypothetical protein E2562_017737 [Oryza meyeriana var. granulata]|uniref:Uncharacterized protein n=1 Tax=Oryza meyeriana var. granulata TaxID=110450 RepID=A0A6G1BYP2_9ORYZ|nr:hypothetical protein E2562_017737 [Oryza meyeriana var. granulata]
MTTTVVPYEKQDPDKKHFKWLRFSKEKDRGLEKMRLENEKMKLENERLELELKLKEIEMESIDHLEVLVGTYILTTSALQAR